MAQTRWVGTWPTLFLPLPSFSLTNSARFVPLLVTFTRLKLAPLLIQVSPVAGESGWMCNGFLSSGSALPATAQRELWNFQRFVSHGTMSCREGEGKMGAADRPPIHTDHDHVVVRLFVQSGQFDLQCRKDSPENVLGELTSGEGRRSKAEWECGRQGWPIPIPSMPVSPFPYSLPLSDKIFVVCQLLAPFPAEYRHTRAFPSPFPAFSSPIESRQRGVMEWKRGGGRGKSFRACG